MTVTRSIARKCLTWLLPLILAQSPLAEAQVALPGARLPGLPGALNGLPVNADRALSGLSSDASPRLQDLRRLRIRDLIRSHPKEVEADSEGAPILRGEVAALSPTDAALEKARAAGFVILRERELDGLDARVVILKAPERVDTRRALRQLRALDPDGTYDFNHLYLDGGLSESARVQTEPSGLSTPQVTPFVAPPRIGLVDSGVDVAHTVFRDIVIHRHGCSGTPAPAAHGTAVASLMVGRSAQFRGAAPGSELYAADVYCGLATGGAVDAVVDALAWLVREHVPVMNVSLVGPPNSMLENVVRMVITRGHLIVAAVGNDGPAAPPLYPASYPGVVGVTAVDAHQRALLEACRGKQVKFSAPGADISAANPGQGYATVRGTSFASPIVAGLLAGSLREPDKAAAERVVAELAAHAVDLGSPGPDPVYGFGLVGGDLRPELALVGNRSN